MSLKMVRATRSNDSLRPVYTVYGLAVSSDIELPELRTVSGKIPDVDILLTEIGPELEGADNVGAWVQFAPNKCQINVEGVARYRIESGQRILVEPFDGKGAEWSAVRLYLLGTALGILLHQRRCLPLHVSALATPAGVWAFSGPSGAGKSTLAAWLHYKMRWPLFCDDVGVLRPYDQGLEFYPGPPRLKLWRNTITKLNIDERNLDRDVTRADKFHLSMHQSPECDPQPLSGLVMLEQVADDEPPVLERVTGASVFSAVLSSIYRPEFGMKFSSPLALLRDYAHRLDQVRVYRLRRPWLLRDLEIGLKPLVTEVERISAAQVIGQVSANKSSDTMVLPPIRRGQLS